MSGVYRKALEAHGLKQVVPGDEIAGAGDECDLWRAWGEGRLHVRRMY